MAHPHLLRLLELTHLDRLLPVYDSRDAALSGNASSLPVDGNVAKLFPPTGVEDVHQVDTDVTS